MTPSATALASPIAFRSDRDWMLDRLVVHKIVVALEATHPALSDLLDELARAQGSLQSLTVRPVGRRFEAVLHASRLSPEAARRLVDRYAALPEVMSASIEHMLVR